MPGGLEVPDRLVDTILARLNYLIGILFVPPVISLHPSAGKHTIREELTQVGGNTGGIRSGAGLRHLHGDQRL